MVTAWPIYLSSGISPLNFLLELYLNQLVFHKSDVTATAKVANGIWSRSYPGYIWTRSVTAELQLGRISSYTHETDITLSFVINIVTYSGFYIHDGTLLHSKSQYTTVKDSRKLLEHTYTSDPHGLGTLTPTEFFQQDLLWQSSNTHSHSCSKKASKHTSRQSVVGLSVHLHTTTAPQRSLL
jgi:hypothetical protein